MENLQTTIILIGESLAILTVLSCALYLVHQRMLSAYQDKPGAQFRRQLIMVGLVLAAVLAAIILLPIGDTMRGQLLGLLGIVLSATIALSATTFVGNAMAGLMIRTMRSFRLGNYIEVGAHAGRITEMDLLHVEIQTEDRDLTTLPNLFIVSNPVRVMRSSGTVIHVDVSLGYDIPRKRVEQLLLQAAAAAKLETPFVQVTTLGDFSVTYRIAGLLTDLKTLISTRRQLRACMLDYLHGGGIEIVSPTFMNTRVFDKDAAFIPEMPAFVEDTDDTTSVDSMLFDKAEKAELIDSLQSAAAEAEQKIKEIRGTISDKTDETQRAAAEASIQKLQSRHERLEKLITRTKERIEQKDH